jgi:hypothetical protein
MLTKVSTLAVFFAVILASCSVTKPNPRKPHTEPSVIDFPVATAAQSAHNPKVVGDGVWKVGLEVEVGTYTTTAPDTTPGCYWARLKAFDGEPTSIIRNGLVSQGGKGRFTINKNDVGVQFSGECIWKKES